ncbi:unnamed protein product [Rhizophagus irregularis]|nr:unnamed protein product [Rhizophagus irregularis]CAB4440215.1 unnamed protein product [Rhizophagus irregularis]
MINNINYSYILGLALLNQTQKIKINYFDSKMNIPPPNETESPNNAPLLNDDETDSKTAKKTSWVWTYWDEETQEIKGVSR